MAFTVEAGEAWVVNLSSVFTDADGDELTYTVRRGDLTIDIPAVYGFTFEDSGTYTLVFIANDGQADSPTYTVTLTVSAPPAPVEKQAKELAGLGRYDTAQKIVEEAFSETGSTYVIVASGENFPDALAASSLAGLLDCPVVLTAGKALSSQAVATISELGATKAIIVGGTGAVSDAAKASVKDLTGSDPVRLSGNDRYATMLAIYGHDDVDAPDWGDTAILATGTGYAGGPRAGRLHPRRHRGRHRRGSPERGGVRQGPGGR